MFGLGKRNGGSGAASVLNGLDGCLLLLVLMLFISPALACAFLGWLYQAELSAIFTPGFVRVIVAVILATLFVSAVAWPLVSILRARYQSQAPAPPAAETNQVFVVGGGGVARPIVEGPPAAPKPDGLQPPVFGRIPYSVAGGAPRLTSGAPGGGIGWRQPKS